MVYLRYFLLFFSCAFLYSEAHLLNIDQMRAPPFRNFIRIQRLRPAIRHWELISRTLILARLHDCRKCYESFTKSFESAGLERPDIALESDLRNLKYSLNHYQWKTAKKIKAHRRAASQLADASFIFELAAASKPKMVDESEDLLPNEYLESVHAKKGVKELPSDIELPNVIPKGKILPPTPQELLEEKQALERLEERRAQWAKEAKESLEPDLELPQEVLNSLDFTTKGFFRQPDIELPDSLLQIKYDIRSGVKSKVSGGVDQTQKELKKKFDVDAYVRTHYRSPTQSLPRKSINEVILTMFDNLSLLRNSELSVVGQSYLALQKAAPFDELLKFNVTSNNLHHLENNVFDIRAPKNAHEIIASAAASKKLRVGTTFLISANTDQYLGYLNPITYKVFDIINFNQSTISFSITQPLLRGFLYGQDTVQERVDRLTIRAIYYDYLASLTDDLLSVLQKYWVLTAAQQTLDERIIDLEKLRILVRRLDDMHSKEDWVVNYRKELEVKLAARASAVTVAEGDIVKALEDLRLAMGMRASICRSLNMQEAFASEPFPPLDLNIGEKIYEKKEAFLAYALENRYEILADLVRYDVANMQLKGARNEWLPQLDFFGSYNLYNFSFGERSKQFLSALQYVKYRPQRTLTVGVNFNLPFNNFEGVGQVNQKKALLEQSVYTIQRRQEQIGRDIYYTTAQIQNLVGLLIADDATIRGYRDITESYIEFKNPGDIAAYIGYDEKARDGILDKISHYSDMMSNLLTMDKDIGTLIIPFLDQPQTYRSIPKSQAIKASNRVP